MCWRHILGYPSRAGVPTIDVTSNPELAESGRHHVFYDHRRRIVRADDCGRWLKRKGVAHVRLATGEVALAEIHWYECAGIGKREFKIKRFL
jgi:hypothetical protein